MAFCEGAVEANSGLAIAGGETEGGSATQGPDLQTLIPWCSGLKSSLYHYMPGAHHINCWQLIISSGKEVPASKFKFLCKLLSFHYCADISYIQFHWVCTFCIQHAHWSLIWSPTSFFLQLQHYWGNLSKKMGPAQENPVLPDSFTQIFKRFVYSQASDPCILNIEPSWLVAAVSETWIGNERLSE